MEPEIGINLDGLNFKLNPLPAYPIFRTLPANDPVHKGRTGQLFKWDCATRTGVPRRPARRAPILPVFYWRDLSERNPAQSVLKSKAKMADFLLAFDLAPSALERELQRVFSPTIRNIDWASILRRNQNHSFEVYLTIKYAYFVARPNFTPAQMREPLVRAVANKYFLIGLPVSHTLKIKYINTCVPGGVVPQDTEETVVAQGDDAYRALLWWHNIYWVSQVLSPLPFGGMIHLPEPNGELPEDSSSEGEEGPGSEEVPEENDEDSDDGHGGLIPPSPYGAYASLGTPLDPEKTLASLEPQETDGSLYEFADIEAILKEIGNTEA
jgi:hypothetical protein